MPSPPCQPLTVAGAGDGSDGSAKRETPVHAQQEGRTGLSRDEYLSSLPEVKRNLLEAARRLFAQGGFPSLRLDAIAREANENKAMIRYYFGDKDGLVSALVESLIHDATLTLVQQAEALPLGDRERAHVYLMGAREIADNPEQRASLFEVLPEALRNEKFRVQLADLYRWYREMNERCLGVRPRHAELRQDVRARHAGPGCHRRSGHPGRIGPREGGHRSGVRSLGAHCGAGAQAPQSNRVERANARGVIARTSLTGAASIAAHLISRLATAFSTPVMVRGMLLHVALESVDPEFGLHPDLSIASSGNQVFKEIQASEIPTIVVVAAVTQRRASRPRSCASVPPEARSPGP